MTRLLLLLLAPIAAGCILLAPPHRVAGLPAPSEVKSTVACANEPATRRLPGRPTKACRDEHAAGRERY